MSAETVGSPVDPAGTVRVRPARPADASALSAVHESAFGPGDGAEIIALLEGLLADDTARPVLSLVAEAGEQVIGHVLFTAVRIAGREGAHTASILAPLAVHAAHQRRGAGSALVTQGLDHLADRGVALVFVLGHAGYYARFGFRPAAPLGFEPPRAITTEQEAGWMVLPLKAGTLGAVRGVVRCARTLEDPRYWHG